jgi:hypothetical protein
MPMRVTEVRLAREIDVQAVSALDGARIIIGAPLASRRRVMATSAAFSSDDVLGGAASTSPAHRASLRHGVQDAAAASREGRSMP